MLLRGDVPIATPCGIDLTKMTRREATKLWCTDCKKHVHDLTFMTEAEARALLASSNTEGLCVRYAADERGRIVFLPDVPTSSLTARRRMSLGAAALAAAVGASGCLAPPMVAGGIAPMPPAPRESTTSYEMVRGDVRVSLSDVPGSIEMGGAAQEVVGSHYASGRCAADEQGCADVRAAVARAQSIDELVGELERAGFTVVQKAVCKHPSEVPAT